MWIMIIIAIRPMFIRLPANQKLFNRIGNIWYHFTSRKIPYLMVSVNFVTFWSYGLSIFLDTLNHKRKSDTIVFFL